MDKPKKIDWSKLKKKWPKCGSINLEKINEYKRQYDDKYRLKELRKIKCKDCGNEFWV